MLNQKRDVFPAPATPKELGQQEPFTQIEVEFTGAQLERMADALVQLIALYTHFKQELMSKHQSGKFSALCSNPPCQGSTDSNH